MSEPKPDLVESLVSASFYVVAGGENASDKMQRYRKEIIRRTLSSSPELAQVREAVEYLTNESAVEFSDERLGYDSIQISKGWKEAGEKALAVLDSLLANGKGQG